MFWYVCMMVMGTMQCWTPPLSTLEECKAARDSIAQQIEFEKIKKETPLVIGCFGTPQAFPAPKTEGGA